MSSVDNELPDGWLECSLGETVEILSSKRIFAADYVPEGIPFYRSKETIEKSKGEVISNPLYISPKRFNDIKNSHGSPINGDILLSAVGERAGIPYLVKNESDFYFKDGNLIWFRNFTNKIDSEYLSYFFNSRIGQHKLESQMIGSAQKALTIVGLKGMLLELPPIQEQKAIAKVLTAFDDKIENLRAQNQTLEQTAQTIFAAWFGKYQIGDELPEGLRVGKIEDLVGELESGKRPKGGVGNILEGIPSIGAESIGGITNFDYSKTKYVPIDFFKKMNRGIVKEYDILVYKDGGTPGTFIPKFSMFGEGFPFKVFCINEHVFRVQPKFEYQRFYLYQWLNSYYCKKQLQNIGGKAAIPGINSTDFKNLEIIIPQEDLIKEFNKLVKDFYKKILTNMTQIQSLSKTRDALLPKLMRGEIRVNGFENNNT
ncbi:restriction endonuclease subunit S [Lacinutrix iliipiscaria]|uniref:Restriction endonuclease subunit S n=1 Tax=Lacinutrix iliipiscaria TaxID=1230532 RepID=A0ABW5WQV3_9FLAO